MDQIARHEALSAQDLLALGLRQIAYVRPVPGEEGGFSIHTADGTEVTVLPSREMAEAVIRQHDLEPVSVH
ncbi:MAG: DUF1150 family protein [Kiloniellales bacterium]